MKHLIIITSVVALIALAGPVATQLRADDAHHPERAAKSGKASKAKTKQQKRKPAEKANKSNQSEMRFGGRAQKV